MQLHTASRQKSKLRIGLSGPSGSGKTYSALQLAYGLAHDWNKIALIDTENGSGDLYSHLGAYQVLTLTAPFTPERYIEAIKACEDAGMEVIIIDSISHEWNGAGGCLELHDQVTAKMKTPNSFTAWAQITPRHDKFIQTILQSQCHVITTVRSKTEYILVDKNGRQVPQKAGMGQVTRDGFEYELTLSLDLDQDHKAFASKDRTRLFADAVPEVVSVATGEKLLEWAGQEDKITPAQLESLKAEIERTKPDVDKMLEHYQVKALEEMSQIKAEKVLALLHKRADASVEEKPDQEIEESQANELPDGSIAH